MLFGAGVAPTRSVCVGYALAFFFVSCSTPLVRNILVPARRAGAVLFSVTVSLVLGLTGIFIGARSLGAAGVGLAGGGAELVNLGVLSWRSRSILAFDASSPDDRDPETHRHELAAAQSKPGE
jgi:O-antigen/teichoic acid export membrane protein